MVGQYNDVECTLAMCILYDTAKHICNHLDAVNRIEICLKIRRYNIPVSRFFAEHAIEVAPVNDVASRVAEATVGSKIIRALEIVRVKKLIFNTVL